MVRAWETVAVTPRWSLLVVLTLSPAPFPALTRREQACGHLPVCRLRHVLQNSQGFCSLPSCSANRRALVWGASSVFHHFCVLRGPWPQHHPDSHCESLAFSLLVNAFLCAGQSRQAGKLNSRYTHAPFHFVLLEQT